VGDAAAWVARSTLGTAIKKIGGNVSLQADNNASVESVVINGSTSAGGSASVTLALNSVGYAAYNILLNTVDAIIGSPLLTGAEQAAGATARLTD
jgi:mucin-19